MYYVKLALGDEEENLSQIEEVVDICTDVTYSDRCEHAASIGKCLAENSKLRSVMQFYFE